MLLKKTIRHMNMIKNETDENNANNNDDDDAEHNESD